MISPSRFGRIVLLSLVGAVVGYLVLHPYTMLIYGLTGHLGAAKGWPGAGHLFRDVLYSFHPSMLTMGIPFALLGAVAGLFLGFWVDARRQRFELEKRLLAQETLRNLTMTLAHYLLNAAQVVGGFATRDIKREQDERIKRHLEMMRNEATRIEAVVKSLQSLESFKSDRFLKDGDAAMIDIQEELRKRLEVLKRRP